MSRVYLYQLLKEDAQSTDPGTLGDVGAKPNLYAGEVDTPEGDTFLILRFGSITPGVDPVTSSALAVWAYDNSKDYTRIDNMLKRVRTLLEQTEAQKTSTGWITCIDWEGDSDDLADDTYHRITKNSSYTLIDSGR